MDPKKDPHEKIKPQIRKLRDLIIRLEKRGFVMRFKWGSGEATGSYGTKTNCMELALPYVDFSPGLGTYYIKMLGGATVAWIYRLTKRLIEEKPRSTEKDWKLVKELNIWAKKKQCKMKVIYIQGSSKIFETARFQLLKADKIKLKKKRKPRKYYANPFGSFEHFKKVVRKFGHRKYINYLKNKNFYLRVREKIPAEEIKRLR